MNKIPNYWWEMTKDPEKLFNAYSEILYITNRKKLLILCRVLHSAFSPYPGVLSCIENLADGDIYLDQFNVDMLRYIKKYKKANWLNQLISRVEDIDTDLKFTLHYSTHYNDSEECIDRCNVLREILGKVYNRKSNELNTSLPISQSTYAFAKDIYYTKDFKTLPILGDMLEDVGCTDVDVLEHLRDTGSIHYRGCWALDLVLGKN